MVFQPQPKHCAVVGVAATAFPLWHTPSGTQVCSVTPATASTDTPIVFSRVAADLLLFYVGDRGGGVEATVGMCGRAASAVASAGRERAAPPPVNTGLFRDPGLFRDRRLIQHRVTLEAVHCRQREYTPPCRFSKEGGWELKFKVKGATIVRRRASAGAAVGQRGGRAGAETCPG